MSRGGTDEGPVEPAPASSRPAAGEPPPRRDARRTLYRVVEIALGTLLCVALLAVLEYGSLELNLRAESRTPKWEGTYVEGYFRPHARLGYGPRQASVVTSRRRHEGRLVYDVAYRTDELGRRVSPVPGMGERSRHAIFLGCSFTFGEGVEDDETLPSQFGREAPGYRPYNYGFCGYGPQAALARLEDPSFRSGVAEPEGLAVFVYLVGHERRAVGSMRVVTQWGAGMPSYVVDRAGNVSNEGSFRQSHRLRMKLYGVLARSELLRLAGVDVPLRIGDADYERTARILAAARDAYLRSFRGRFVVVVFPTADRRLRILPYLRRLGVEVVDFSRLLDPDAPGLQLAGDGHPSARAYRIVARSLARRLDARAPGRGAAEGGS